MSDFYLSVRKAVDPHYPIIEIEIRINPDPWSGSINIIKTFDLENPLELIPAVVRKNFNFRYDLTPDKVRHIAEWLNLAAQTAEALDSLVKTRDDLSRPVMVRLEGRMVIVEFEE